MKFAVLGRTHWLRDSAVAAISRGHQLVLVGTCPGAPEYRVRESDFQRLADDAGCPYFCTTRINDRDYLDMLISSRAEVAISLNWLSLLGQQILSIPPHGVVNCHLGDLPRYRGNAPAAWAIINGEKEVVLTLHRMEPELDAGPIILQRRLPITEGTYVGDIYAWMDRAVPEQFAELLDGLEAGTLTVRAQHEDNALALRCFPRKAEDGYLDWSCSAEDLARLVRASAEPFEGAFSFVESELLTIWRAYHSWLPYPTLGIPGQIVERRPGSGEVLVLTGKGVLVLQEVETASGGRRKAAEMIRSLRQRLGLNPVSELQTLRKRVDELEKGSQSN